MAQTLWLHEPSKDCYFFQNEILILNIFSLKAIISVWSTPLVLKPEYSRRIRLMPRLLMPWFPASLGHQQSRYCRINRSMLYMKKHFNYLQRNYKTTCMKSVLCMLMAWCFSTRASAYTVLTNLILRPGLLIVWFRNINTTNQYFLTMNCPDKNIHLKFMVKQDKK